jgi:hypothetical protein
VAIVARILVEAAGVEDHDRLEQAVETRFVDGPPDGLMVHLGYPQGDHLLIVDAWRTEELFALELMIALPSLLRVLRPGGQLGVATVGMVRDVRDLGFIPDHVGGVVGWEALTWHSPERVRQQWDLAGLVDVTTARLQRSGLGRLAALVEGPACAPRGGCERRDRRRSASAVVAGHEPSHAVE